MFDNDNDDLHEKGLFTFYRQQAEFQDKIKKQKRKLQQEINKKLKQKKKQKIIEPVQPLPKLQENQKQSNQSPGTKFFSNKSFEKLNKQYVKKLSQQNSISNDFTHNKFGSSVIIILKGNNKNSQTQKLHYKRHNTKFNSSEGYFIKEKQIDFQEEKNKNQLITDYPIEIEDQTKFNRKVIKRNHSVNDRYLNFKRQLQTQLLLNEQSNTHRQSYSTSKNKIDGIKKVDLLSQLPELNKSTSRSNQQSNYRQTSKKMPPKALVSILKSQNHQMIRQLRKAIQKQKQEWKDEYIKRNSSFIDYNNYRYESPQNHNHKFNQKQKRLLNILNKFNKRI